MKRRWSPILIPGKREKLLTAFKEEVCRNPDSVNIKAFAAEFRKLEKEREKRLLDVLFLTLYERDAKALRRDLAKLSVFGGKAEVAPSQRIALLRCLYGVLALYVKDHFPETDAMVEGAARMEDRGSFLDTSG